VPVRLLIGPGLIVIGAGLLLMRGLDAGSAWTHLIPGMIVGGVGVGIVNPPLASTAVGVVPPRRAGMASGISSTFRQVGIATGIALLGTLFSNNVKDEVLARVAEVPGLSRSGPRIAAAVQSGEIRNVIAPLPEHARPAVGMITRAAFTTGLNRILLVAEPAGPAQVGRARAGFPAQPGLQRPGHGREGGRRRSGADPGRGADHLRIHGPQHLEDPVGVTAPVLSEVLPPGHARREVGSVTGQRPFTPQRGVRGNRDFGDRAIPPRRRHHELHRH
jgi:hypothetical protein